MPTGKTIQTRVYHATLARVKDEVLHRRKERKFQPPLDTPASVIRDAVALLLDGDSEDPMAEMPSGPRLKT